MKEESSSFLKKRTKKLLIAVADLSQAPPKDIKVFCFFFSKKKAFSFFFEMGQILVK